MIVVDLCCGLGGFSAPWRDAGHEVISVDTDARLNPTICADVRTLKRSDFPDHVDVVLAAPPCTEYSRLDMPWLRKTAPQPDLSLWGACVRIARELNPEAFVLENVRGAIPFWGPPMLAAAPRFFWGWFPVFYVPKDKSKRYDRSCKWVRPLVPNSTSAERDYWARSFISRPVAEAVMDGILSQPSIWRQKS